MNKQSVMDDGSVLTWMDRQTVKYEKDGYIVLVWVDFDSGFSIRKRVIKLESLKNWRSTPRNVSDRDISSQQRYSIVNSVRDFFNLRGISCRTE